ncbi:beta-N-acetylhexosaminidase [Asticcacaulis tiandongensis]|uniref:beta-N-acetylhexosaminidase n=1 Tax=Asticcacaulis tiandongensis TaxID=2565365 RepID=UPI001126ED4E|nr:beta-N-acetylhexosaminidase [Asticcacaulis tiandongensis]
MIEKRRHLIRSLLRSRLPVSACLILGLACAGHAQTLSAASPDITPAPSQWQAATGHFNLTATTIIHLQDEGTAAHIPQYLADQIFKTTGLRLTSSTDTSAPQISAHTPTIRLILNPDHKIPIEGYILRITPDGIRIEAGDSAGLFYGAVSLWQVMTTHGTTLPAMTITDAPRYKWRGLMIDSARHFQTPDELKRIIDAMAAHKLNLLHWHLVDDQAWRLEIRKYPRLTEISAHRQPAGAQGFDTNGQPVSYGGFYTQAEVRDLVAYAQARHITIVPEIEMPGHALSAIRAYPQYGVTGETPDEDMNDWGIYPYLYNVDDATFAFLTDILDEVIDLFPSPYIHIGGDEAIKNQWEQSPYVQRRIRELGLKNEHELQSWFITRIGEHLTKRGRRLVGWDEILEGGLAPDATVMSWQGLDGAKAAARMGHDTVLSPWPELYLDSRQSLTPDGLPGRGALSTLRMVYDFDSTPEDMTAAEHRHIIGVQANAFTEHMRTSERLEMMTFPRLLALSEVGWTSETNRNWQDFSNRLPSGLKRLDEIGVKYNAIPFTPDISLTPNGSDKARVSLTLPLEIGQVHYRLNDAAYRPYQGAFDTALPVTLRAQTHFNGKPLGPERVYDLTTEAAHTRQSHKLLPCAADIFPHLLEDDAPTSGERAVFAINVYKSCWIWPQIDLSQTYDVTVRIGQVPFNFQLAGGRREVIVGQPETPLGELLIRRRTDTTDQCTGEILATLPLSANNTKTPTLSTLTGQMPATSGTDDICFSFNRPSIDPVWAIDQITLLPSTASKSIRGN